VGQAYPAGVVVRYAVREGISLLAGLPVAVVGMALHGLPYGLTAALVARLRVDADTVATYKLGTGLVVYPLAWLAEGWVAWRLAGGWGLAAVVLALVPAGFFALAWHHRLARVRRQVRGFLRFLRDRNLHRRLADRRRALADELQALAALVPDDVLGGRTPR
jgi:hypothetical protein